MEAFLKAESPKSRIAKGELWCAKITTRREWSRLDSELGSYLWRSVGFGQLEAAKLLFDHMALAQIFPLERPSQRRGICEESVQDRQRLRNHRVRQRLCGLFWSSHKNSDGVRLATETKSIRSLLCNMASKTGQPEPSPSQPSQAPHLAHTQPPLHPKPTADQN